MADNVAITAGSGTSVATDDVAGAHYQRVKLDAGGDGAAVPILAGGGVEASALRVTIANDSTGLVSVDDNGGSLTVDGTVTANLAAGVNNIGDVDVLTLPNVTIGTMAALVAGTANIGDVDVLTVPAPLSTTGGGAEATALRVTLANDSTGLVSVDDNGGSLTVDGTVAATQSGTWNVTNVSGTVSLPTGAATLAEQQTQTTALSLLDDTVKADDAAFTVGTDKVIMSGHQAVAHGANPDAADALDAVVSITNRHRIPFFLGGHPNIITRTVYISDATGAQTDVSIVGTIAPGAKVAVTSVAVTVDSATTATGGVAVKLGFGATTIPADSATGAAGILLDHKGIAAGSGVVLGAGAGLLGIGADGEELRLTCEDPVGGGLSVMFSYFTIES